MEGFPIKVAGALSGCVYLPSLDAAVQQLREEVARLMGVQDAKTVKLIAAGRNLQDDSQPLTYYGITPQSRVLVTRGAEGSLAVNKEADRRAKLEKLQHVMEHMASRDARGLTDDFAFAVENQDGGRLDLKPEDQKSLVMGLAMHERGKSSLEQGDFEQALEELLMAENAFALCSPRVTQLVDNVGMLLLDVVWCCYKLQDLRRIAVGRERLNRARTALARAHGPNMERVRHVHGRFCPELAVYVRLEVLEGIVAYYSQDLAAAQKSLEAAQAKLHQLQVPDEQLVLLQGMGYTLKESRRALRFSGGDVDAAATFIIQQREANEKRKAKRKRQQEWRDERGKYGKTASGVYVDLDALDALCQMGYDKPLAAEALRQADNNATAALESLLDRDKHTAIMLSAVAQNYQASGSDSAGPSAAQPDSLAASLASQLAEAIAAAASATAGQDANQASTSATPNVNPDANAAPGTLAAEAVPDTGRTESDQEVEDEIVSKVKSGQDPMEAYDIDLSDEAEMVSLYLALVQSAAS